MDSGRVQSPRRPLRSAAGLALCAIVLLAMGERTARGAARDSACEAPVSGAVLLGTDPSSPGGECAEPAETEGGSPAAAAAEPSPGLSEGAETTPDPIPFQTGKASYYHPSLEGRPTANGEPYRGNELTAAHRTLPFGTVVRVVNLNTGHSVVVRINDRGPFVRRRVIDLSKSAARELHMVQQGVAPVALEILEHEAH